MKRIVFSLCLVTVILGSHSLSAALMTTDISNDSTVKTIDFGQFTTNQYTNGPVQIGTLIAENVVCSTDNTIMVGVESWGLGLNGRWQDGQSFVGLCTNIGYIQFDFVDGAVRSAGVFMNYVPGQAGVYLEALDSNNKILESYVISSVAPVSTPSAINDGGFRGITRATADIAALRIRNGHDVVDDLTFSRIPEPATLCLFALGAMWLSTKEKTVI